MLDIAHLRSGMFLLFTSKRRMGGREPTEFYDDEGRAYLAQNWRHTLDQIRRYEYPIDYEDE